MCVHDLFPHHYVTPSISVFISYFPTRDFESPCNPVEHITRLLLYDQQVSTIVHILALDSSVCLGSVPPLRGTLFQC